jgi:hypothetical protein
MENRPQVSLLRCSGRDDNEDAMRSDLNFVKGVMRA